MSVPAASSMDEYDDESHRLSKILRLYACNLYGNDDFQRAAAALLRRGGGDISALSSQQRRELLSNGMNCISPQERARALEELHGTRQDLEETEPLVRHSLMAMENYLTLVMPCYKASAYRTVLETNPAYGRDINFRLMFLRSVYFHPIDAADRMMLFFTLKLALFGEEKLTRDITAEDIGTEALEILQSGYLQPLPVRDRSGRAVLIARPPIFTRTSLLIATWFAFMNVVQNDLLTQRKGFVIVGYNVGPQRIIDHRVWRDLAFCTRALPIQILARHSMEDQSENIVFVLNRYYMLPKFRIQFRQYHEVDLESYHHELRRHGIPMQVFAMPGLSEEKLVSRSQINSVQQLHSFIFLQKYVSAHGIPVNSGGDDDNVANIVVDDEDADDDDDDDDEMDDDDDDDDDESENDIFPILIRDLGENDVVLGSGNSCTISGNELVNSKMQEYVAQYREANKAQKDIITDTIIGLVHKSGGRFLELMEDETDGDGYIEVLQNTARQKISRQMRRLQDKRR